MTLEPGDFFRAWEPTFNTWLFGRILQHDEKVLSFTYYENPVIPRIMYSQITIPNLSNNRENRRVYTNILLALEPI